MLLLLRSITNHFAMQPHGTPKVVNRRYPHAATTRIMKFFIIDAVDATGV